MSELAAAWTAAMLGSVLVERMTNPRSPYFAEGLRGNVLRLAVSSFIFAFFLVVSWRPWFAVAATLVLVGVFVAISNGKLAYTYEPLVFSDLAFVIDVFRHATLFHTTFLGPLFVLAAVAAIAGFAGFWCSFETPLGVGGQWAALVAWITLTLLPAVPAARREIARRLLAFKSDPDVDRDIPRHGLMATLVVDTLIWLGEDRSQRIAAWTPPSPMVRRSDTRPAADLIVAVQCESFMDFRRLDAARLRLPNLDAARARALGWGRLGSAFAGGYTMRTEVSFLTGRRHRDLGFDRYYPYLNAGAYGGAGLPGALRSQGYDTVFIHPFHREFFQRQRAMPALGFQRMITLEEFEDAPLVGAYVSDKAVGERILAEARATAGRPAFLFAATMENHEPWGPGRFESSADPISVYKRHIENGDALLGSLVTSFDEWPGRVVLAFYGDHVPLLKAFADPFMDSDTDYVLLELGRGARPSSPSDERRLEIHDLSWRMLAAAGMTD